MSLAANTMQRGNSRAAGQACLYGFACMRGIRSETPGGSLMSPVVYCHWAIGETASQLADLGVLSHSRNVRRFHEELAKKTKNPLRVKGPTQPICEAVHRARKAFGHNGGEQYLTREQNSSLYTQGWENQNAKRPAIWGWGAWLTAAAWRLLFLRRRPDAAGFISQPRRFRQSAVADRLCPYGPSQAIAAKSALRVARQRHRSRALYRPAAIGLLGIVSYVQPYNFACLAPCTR